MDKIRLPVGVSIRKKFCPLSARDGAKTITSLPWTLDAQTLSKLSENLVVDNLVDNTENRDKVMKSNA